MLSSNQKTPIVINGSSAKARGTTTADRDKFDFAVKSLFSNAGSYLEGLGQVDLPAEIRARNPIVNHPWVAASVLITAIVATQASYSIWTETDTEQTKRRLKAKRLGRDIGNKAGKERRALQRHDIRNVYQRIMKKGLELDETHPIVELLENPNPFQDGGQLFFMTHMLLCAEGELFWVYTDDNGIPDSISPTRVYPMRATFFTPIFTKNNGGDLIGFRYRTPLWMPQGPGVNVDIPITAITHFKYPHPYNPIVGFSRLTAAASSIESSLLSRAWNRSTLQNSGVPKGVITYEGMMDKGKREEFMSKWQDKFEGPENQGRTAILSSGFQYQNIGLSPHDMQWDNLVDEDRKEVLAVMSTPGSVLSLSESMSYATQQGQDRNFWDKSILPMFRVEERALDRTLLYTETDSVVGGFDLSTIESLRIGLDMKINQAVQLASQNLHVPPTVAYEAVGLELADYEGDDVCFVSSLSTPVSEILKPSIIPSTLMPFTGGNVEEDPNASVDEEEEDTTEVTSEDSDIPTDIDPNEDTEEPKRDNTKDKRDNTKGSGLAASCYTLIRKAKTAKIWKRFVTVQTIHEAQMASKYSSWIRAERKAAFELFDQVAKEANAKSLIFDTALFKEVQNPTLSLVKLVPDLAKSKTKLSQLVRPLYADQTLNTYELTLEEIGIPTFQIDDVHIQRYFEEREKLFTNSVPNTLTARLLESLKQGFSNGDTLLQLRIRLGEVYNMSASPGKVSTVARTETSSFMNGVRDRMFDLQGFTTEDWASAEDEATREDHILIGRAGPHNRGFNWLEVVNQSTLGILEYPGDIRAPLHQTANCRCAKLAVS